MQIIIWSTGVVTCVASLYVFAIFGQLYLARSTAAKINQSLQKILVDETTESDAKTILAPYADDRQEVSMRVGDMNAKGVGYSVKGGSIRLSRIGCPAYYTAAVFFSNGRVVRKEVSLQPPQNRDCLVVATSEATAAFDEMRSRYGSSDVHITATGVNWRVYVKPTASPDLLSSAFGYQVSCMTVIIPCTRTDQVLPGFAAILSRVEAQK
jgi:hypothetical protein